MSDTYNKILNGELSSGDAAILKDTVRRQV